MQNATQPPVSTRFYSHYCLQCSRSAEGGIGRARAGGSVSHIVRPIAAVLMVVPKNAYVQIAPTFLMKGFVSRE